MSQPKDAKSMNDNNYAAFLTRVTRVSIATWVDMGGAWPDTDQFADLRDLLDDFFSELRPEGT